MSIDSKTVQVYELENGVEREIEIIDKSETKDADANEFTRKIVLKEDLSKGRNYEIRFWFYKSTSSFRKRGLHSNNW